MPKRVSTLPPPLPDETVFSVASRIHYAIGSASSVATSLMLFGYRGAALYVSMPLGLEHFSEVTGGILGSGGDIFRRRTPWGLQTKFEPESAQRMIDGCLQGRGAGARTMPRGTPFGNADKVLKACPECIKEDREKIATPVWHVRHQWVGAFACARHGVPLLHLQITSNQWVRLQDAALTQGPHCQTPEKLKSAVRLAKMLDALDQEPELTGAALRETALATLASQGLVASSKRPRSEAFDRWWSDKNTRVVDLEPQFIRFSSPEWASRFLLNRITNHAVGWAAVLCALLDDTEVGAFLQKCQLRQSELFPESMPVGHLGRRDGLPDYIWRLLIRGLDIKYVAVRSGKNPEQLNHWLRLNPEIAAQRSLNVARRQLRRNRNAIESILANAPAATRADLMRASPAAVRWLERNDANWFRARIPSRSQRFRQRALDLRT